MKPLEFKLIPLEKKYEISFVDIENNKKTSILKMYQELSLDEKIKKTEIEIKKFYDKMNGKVCISFSGGKDSTVLLNLVRQLYPDVTAYFADTGLEYPEIKDFVKSIDNVITIRPKISFVDVIEKYGYPVISKKISRYVEDIRNMNKNSKTYKLRMSGYTFAGKYAPSYMLSGKWRFLLDAPFKISNKCCYYMKKEPLNRMQNIKGQKPYVGTLASDSSLRRNIFIKQGCNTYEGLHIMSRPLSIWLEKDIWDYIKTYGIKYSEIYNMGEHNTGCIYCMFGIQYDKCPNRFERMKIHHSALYDYCMNKLKIKDVLDYIKRGFSK